MRCNTLFAFSPSFAPAVRLGAWPVTALALAVLVSAGACNVSQPGNGEQWVAPAPPAPSDNPSDAMAGLDGVWAATTGVHDVGPAEVIARGNGVVLVDVREPHELAGPLGHIPGVLSIPLGQFPSAAASLPEEAPLVVVCRSGNRSGQACRWLERTTGRPCFNLAGGMLAWNRVASR